MCRRRIDAVKDGARARVCGAREAKGNNIIFKSDETAVASNEIWARTWVNGKTCTPARDNNAQHTHTQNIITANGVRIF